MGTEDSDAGRRGGGPAGDGLRGRGRLPRALGDRGCLVGQSVDVDRLFRRESGRAVASLIAALGDFDLAEDAVQEAFAVALERWPQDGVPANPGAWITRVARNGAIDRLRRERNLARKAELLSGLAALEPAYAEGPGEADGGYPDERLRLIFTCCHPALAPESRVALTLRSLGGLSTAEIARAFLATEPATAQRIVRAKRKIRDARIGFEIPAPGQMSDRLPSVLTTLYLIFNEGYIGTASDELVRGNLCAEAIRLAGVLATMIPDERETFGLLALMELTHARRAARVGPDGQLVPLAEQDRSLWDRGEIERGLAHAGRAGEAGPAGPYTVQAAIAATHVRAGRAADTDWPRIVRLYAWLAAFDHSPVVELNRAVAVSEAEGAEAGLELVEAIDGLDDYQPLHVARAELLARLGRPDAARDAFARALELTGNSVQRSFIKRRSSKLAGAAATLSRSSSAAGRAAES